MKEIKLKKRYRLGRKEAGKYLEALEKTYNISIGRSIPVEHGEGGGMEFFIMEGEVIALRHENRYILTVKGIMKFSPETMYVTVDMGAVKFVTNGADVMAPGIVDAWKDIKEGDPVWIRDEKHMRPLAVGIALEDASDMIAGRAGKSIKTINYVGDPIWNITLQR